MSKVVCFDTETTGISLDNDELLQITIVDEDCNILLESYIRPKNRVGWRNAQEVNHISPDMVKDAPTAVELAPKIKEIFDNADIITGYNVMFDVGFVEKDCKIRINRDKVVDCLPIFRQECTNLEVDLPRHKLGNAVDFYCPEAKAEYLSNAHDASCDAIETMRVYKAQQIDQKRYYPVVTSLNESSQRLYNTLLDRALKKEKESAEKEASEQTEEAVVEDNIKTDEKEEIEYDL